VEWFENREQGIEQGWTIATPPVGVDPLWIGLEIEGELHLRIEAGARSGALVDSTGEVHLRYRDLKAYDATGRELHAELVSGSTGVGIRVDDAGAIYPLTVDPLLTGPAWVVEENQPGAQLGVSIASANVNGDDYDDVILGAPLYDAGDINEGCAFVFLGSACNLLESWRAEGNQANALFGQSVSTAGDVNGDGYDDVIVGAPKYDNGQADEGRAFMYLGMGAYPGIKPDAPWTAEGNQVDAQFGWSVASAGSVNGDAYSDVIVGAPRYNSRGRIDDGRVFVYLGASGALPSSVLPPNAGWKRDGYQTGAFFGYSVASAGDVDNDGYGDVIVGAPKYDNPQTDEGRVFVFLGMQAFPGIKLSPIIRRESNQAGAHFGLSVATAGRVNDDLLSDVIIGAPNFDNGQTDEGRAFVYLGMSTTPVWTAESNQPYAQFGWSVASGSLDAGTNSDVIVAAPRYDNGQTNEGRAYVYLGETGGLGANAAWTAESNQANAQFGTSVSAAGDIDGNSYNDVIVGAPLYDNGQADEGGVFVYMGAAANQPTLLGSYNTPGQAIGVVVAGTVAFVADYTSGLQIIDVNNTASPVPLGSCDTPGGAYDVEVVGTVAFVADNNEGLQIIDVIDPYSINSPFSPTLLGSYDTPSSANDVAISGTVAYVADSLGGLQIIDVSDPYSINSPFIPTLLGSYEIGFAAYHVAVSGTVAYVTAGSSLLIINVSVPASPALLGSYITPDTAWGIAIAGTKAYVGGRFCGLQIIDVSVPASPTLLGSYDTLDALGVAVSGTVVFLADTYPGLKILDVTP